MTFKYLLPAFILLFSLSTFFLFWQNDRQLYGGNESFWTLSFATPEIEESLDFTVENFTDNTTFTYVVLEGKKAVAKESFIVEKGEKKIIKLLETAHEGIPTIISVTLGEEKKEIYRK